MTRAELDAHLEPMRSDLREINASLRDITSFMIGARAVDRQHRHMKDDFHFWIGIAAGVFAATATILWLFYP